MVNTKTLAGMKDLKLGGKVDLNSEPQVNSYKIKLETFTHGINDLTTQLRNNVNAKSYTQTDTTLGKIWELLDKIHADGLASECHTQIDKLRASTHRVDNHEVLEAFIERFILNVSSLSIDVQMALKGNSVVTPVRKTPRDTGKRPAIVAVDNAIMFLNTLRKLLQDAPYDLTTITSCTEALDYLKQNHPDIILLDVEMPDMDGYELAKKIKQSGQKAPIIFITANSEREYVDKAVEVGAVGLLMKPLRVNQLIAKIEEFI